MPTKRIKLNNGSTATVDVNCPQSVIDALNGLVELVLEGYVLIESERAHQKGIKCLTCGHISYHTDDIKNLYCGFCNKYHK